VLSRDLEEQQMTNGADPAWSYLSEDDCRLADLIDLVSEKTDAAHYPYASAVEQNVPIYAELAALSARRQTRRAEAIS
jgi:hypothetical protein